MNTQIIFSILIGIVIGVGITLLAGRYYAQKWLQQWVEKNANPGASSTPKKGGAAVESGLLKRKSLFATAIIVGVVVIAVGLLVPLGAEAGESHPDIPLTAEADGSPSFLFQYPGGWLTSGSNIYFDAGNVGIDTANPTERLHVEGNIKLNGNLTSDGDICIGSCN
jgi:hypothetical protein